MQMELHKFLGALNKSTCIQLNKPLEGNHTRQIQIPRFGPMTNDILKHFRVQGWPVTDGVLMWKRAIAQSGSVVSIDINNMR